MNYLKRNLIGGSIFEILWVMIDRLMYVVFFQYYYKKSFKHYGNNIRWGRNFRRKIIPSSVRISCPDKISIFDNVQIDDGVYLQCHEAGDGIIISENVRINAHTHILSFDLIKLEKEVLIAPFCLIASGNHSLGEDATYMASSMKRSGKILIGLGSWLGQGAVILGNTQLGKNSVVGANSIVRGVFQDFSKIVGNHLQRKA